VGCEKVAWWSTKVAISLKSVKIEETLLWRAYRKSLTLFRRVTSPNLYRLLSPRMMVCYPTPKLQSLLSQEWLKLRTANLAIMANTVIVTFGTQAHEKFWRKGSMALVGISKDCPNPLSTPILPVTLFSTNYDKIH